MSANTNAITITGNVTRDPEVKFLNNGSAVTSFGVAVNRSWKDSNDEWQEEVSFFDVTAWRELGENVGDTIAKGDRVIVTGRLQQRTWETDDGDKRSKVDLVADDIGPSLRWATADVTKKERSDDDKSSSSRGGSRSGGRERSGGGDGGNRGDSSGSRRSPRSRTSEPDFEDEPF
jgi:single-strand DNA-binding protein